MPIGGVDEEEGKSLEEETTILSDPKKADMERRFRKTADGVYVEAKRGALGGVTQTPWWMWGLLLVLGQNEIFAGMFFFPHPPLMPTPDDIVVARNPFLILLVLLLGTGAYITFQLNLWGPIIQMSTAAYGQGLTIAKTKLREWLQETETGRQAIAMSGRQGLAKQEDDGGINLQDLGVDGKKKGVVEAEEDI